MTVHYLNKRGIETIINDVVNLQAIGDEFILATSDTGIMFRLKRTGVQGVSPDKVATNNTLSSGMVGSLETEKKKANIWTSGVLCQENPGPGGWGAIIMVNGEKKTLGGGLLPTTRQRMELMAVIEALVSLEGSYDVEITTESKYINDVLAKGWLKNWMANDWKRPSNREVANVDLWKTLVELLQIHTVVFDLN